MSIGLTAVVREAIDELVNVGNSSIVNELFDPNFVSHTSLGDYDLEGFKEFVMSWKRAIPDLQIAMEDIDEEGDRAWWTVHITGTHMHELNGTPPTGKRIDVRMINCMRAVDGRPVEHWVGAQLDDIIPQPRERR